MLKEIRATKQETSVKTGKIWSSIHSTPAGIVATGFVVTDATNAGKFIVPNDHAKSEVTATTIAAVIRPAAASAVACAPVPPTTGLPFAC